MNYTELSLKELRKVSIEAAEKIAKEKKIDLVIYIAKAGFPIAVYMNEVFGGQLLGIGAQRNGNKLKQLVGPLMACYPRFIRDMLITFELKSKIHKKDTGRHVKFHNSIESIDKKRVSSILIVDDSVDTGNSMKLVYETVKKTFVDSKIYTYSLNVWTQSADVFKVDYCSYMNTVIKAPMSKDSKEYQAFCNMYMKKSENGYI